MLKTSVSTKTSEKKGEKKTRKAKGGRQPKPKSSASGGGKQAADKQKSLFRRMVTNVKETPVQETLDIDSCIICDKNLKGFSVREAEMHVNQCIERHHQHLTPSSSSKSKSPPLEKKHSRPPDPTAAPPPSRSYVTPREKIVRPIATPASVSPEIVGELSLDERLEEGARSAIDLSQLTSPVLQTRDATIGGSKNANKNVDKHAISNRNREKHSKYHRASVQQKKHVEAAASCVVCQEPFVGEAPASRTCKTCLSALMDAGFDDLDDEFS
jgi:hypothetical protein